jgi:hypothetical protein
MEGCWHGDPDRRLLLGHVQPLLKEILDNAPM